MIFFDNKYKIVLKMTQSDFVKKLSQMTKLSDDSTANYSHLKKDFVGQIDYHHFSLTRNKNTLFKNNYKLTGTITEYNNEISIEGFIKGYQFTLIFVLAYTFCCIAFLINNLILTPDANENIIALIIFSIVGLINSIGLIYGINKYKNRFVETIENLDNKNQKANKV